MSEDKLRGMYEEYKTLVRKCGDTPMSYADWKPTYRDA